MEEKQKINRKTKSEKIFAVIPKDLKERVIRYKAKTNMSESEIVNVALNEFFKVKYGIEINRLISYEILNNWIYDDEKVNEITHSDIFLPDSDDNSSVFI